MADGHLAAAVKEAATAAFEDSGLPEDPEATVEPLTDPIVTVAEEAPEDEEKDGGADPGEPAPGAGDEVEPAEEDVPTSYFGTDLSAFPAKERADIIAKFQEQNKLINKLQREDAAKPDTPAAPAVETPAAPVVEPVEPEMTDEVLIEALGLDMEDPYDARTAKVAVPLARLVLDLKNQVEGVVTNSTVAETSQVWNTTLDTLESQYGELPVPRIELLERAADEGIADPTTAYWAAVGPLRAKLANEVSELLKERRASDKKAATTPRPRTSTPVEATRLTNTDTKLAVAEAAELAARELGMDWAEATKR